MPTYPLTAPPVIASGDSIWLNQKFNYAQSPYSGAQVATTLGYAEWNLTLDFPVMTLTQAKTFMAWVDRLQGNYGTFTYQPVGSGNGLTGKTLASTANAMTNLISVGGWAAGQASGIALGDYVTVGGQFFRVTVAPTNADGSGNCALEVMPSFRTTTASGTACNFATPTITLRVAGSQNSNSGNTANLAQARTPDGVTVPSLNCVEAR